ncbi:AfsR/SARP family transcriptional regulator [Streptomyces endophyticus]|uniref:Tetratricopeptide repeat protein n=1 Tax=Streptomyces endophyticus TaxID=714166 RepID=A0ABU6FJV3_9ACTN|nr:BTAD domain-containing putative transcriptional regulator [Streptomyces endophyticus]MEB8344335.1 tetratricopeptide repeat protein [Streptomyces endophyticus]
MPIPSELSTEVNPQNPRLHFALLGPPQARRGDGGLELGPVREQALLVALLLRPGRTVSRQQLLDGVWGTEPPGTGTRVIPVYVHRLRRRLDVHGETHSVIETVRGGYRFAPGSAYADVDVDVARWEEARTAGHAAKNSGDLSGAVDAWSRALELFRGEPLAGIPGPFAEGERLRLTEQLLAAMQEKADCQLRSGRHADALAELFSLTTAHPYNEALATLLMRALHAANRQADALDVYATVRRRLIDEQGVEPGAELRRVHAAVLRGDDPFPPLPLDGAAVRERSASQQPTSQRPTFPRPRTDDSPRKHRARDELPVDTSNFTGRERQHRLLVAPADAEEVTVRAVDGMAGVGKTALVVRAARVLRGRHPDGCLFVELHGHREDRETAGRQRVLRRLLRAVGAGEGQDSEDLDELAASWRAATASLRLLLVLDDAARAEQVRPLLPAGPGSLVMVTSRRRLTGLDVDRRVSLSPLGIDEATELLTRVVGGEEGVRDEWVRDEGVREEWAREEWAREEWVGQEGGGAGGGGRESAAVRELATLCGRLPLALRIVGARIQDRPPWAVEALAARLTDDERRLDELAVEDRSVEAAFGVSYAQLPAAEQRAFRVLGLSPTVQLDRLTLAALLDSTPSDAERALENLADASLAQRVTVDRYRLHDLVAVYARRVAAASPDEASAARERVFRLYVAATRCASDWGTSSTPTGPQGTGPFTGWEEATDWLDEAGGELVDVVGQAVSFGLVDEACWIAEGLVDYLTRQGRFHECRTVLEMLLPLLEQATDRRMDSALRIGFGILYGVQGRYQEARAWFTEALDISRRADDHHEQARASAGLGTFANLEGRIAESMEHFAEVLRLAGELTHDDWLTGSIMTRAGDMHHQLGEHDKAYDRYLKAIALAEKAGSPRLLGKTLLRLGGLQLDLGRPAEAVGTLGKAESLARRLGDVPLYAAALDRLSTAEADLGNPEAAADLRRRARTVLDEATDAAPEIALRHRLLWHEAVAEGLSGSRDFFERGTALPDTDANRARISRVLDDLGGRRPAQDGDGPAGR